jgi:hypothetical protein
MFYEVCCLSNNKDYVSQLIHFTGLSVRVRVRVTLQLTVSQSVSLGVEPNLGLLNRVHFFFFFFLNLLSCHLGEDFLLLPLVVSGYFSAYLTGNTLRLRYRAQPVNAVWGNSRCLL